MWELISSDTVGKLTLFKPNPKIAITQKVLNIILQDSVFK